MGFEALLERLCEATDDEDISVRELLNAVGRRAYGPVIMLLGFVSISPLTIVPGATWLVAVLILVIAIQIVLGMQFPWVPKKVLETQFQKKFLTQGVEAALPWAKRIDKFTRPRLTFLTASPFIQFVALGCVAAALVTFPLSFFPFAPVLPGIAILLFGVGLAARDGFFLILSGVALAVATIVAIRVGDRLVDFVQGLF